MIDVKSNLKSSRASSISTLRTTHEELTWRFLFSVSICFSLSLLSLPLLSVSLDGFFDLLEAIVPSENPVEAITTAGPAYPVPSDVLIKQSSDFLKPSFFCSEPHSKDFQKNTLCSVQYHVLRSISIHFEYLKNNTISHLKNYFFSASTADTGPYYTLWYYYLIISKWS